MKEFKKYLKKTAKSPVLLVSHESPDGDAIGSSIGMALLLKDLGLKPLVVNKDPVPDRYKFLEKGIEIRRVADLEPAERNVPYIIFVMDSAKLDRIGFDIDEVFPLHSDVVNIDHHVSNCNFGSKNFVFPKMAATSEIVGNIYLDLFSQIPSNAATAIYTGIMTDTGNLTFESTTAATVALVSILHQMDADFNLMRKSVYESESFNQISGMKTIMNNLKLHHDGYVAYTYLPYEDIANYKLTTGDIENYVDYPRKVATCEIAILYKEFVKDEVRISVRTKGEIDANKLASVFGGGGHKRAAGFRMRKPLQETMAITLERITEGLEKNEWNN